MVFELAKQLRISIVVSGGFANSSHRVPGSWQNLPLPDSALCQLTRRMVFELAKQLRISTVVSGGFANSSHRVLERVGKTYAVDGGKTYATGTNAPPFPTSVENPNLTDNPRLLILAP